MYCPNCAAPVAPQADSCPACGADFSAPAAWKPVPTPPPAKRPKTRLPWMWLLAGAAYGVLLRALAGIAPAVFGAMSFAFLVGTPLAVGAISAYLAPGGRTSLATGAVAPALPMTFMLAGCAVTLLEGSICIALMAPLFYGLAAVGGFCMTLACRLLRREKATLGVFAALPFLLVPVDGAATADTFHELHESVLVAAPPEVVWRNILQARDIRADELPPSLVHRIGVPRPVDAQNRQTAQGETRISRWDKGVHFSAAIVERREYSSISWRYAFTPDSFPPGTMDEHVVLGGRYIDLGDTTFNLSPAPGGRTRLEVVGRYRLTTPVNFYAVPASRLLGRDFLRMLLGFYKGRAEREAGAESATT